MTRHGRNLPPPDGRGGQYTKEAHVADLADEADTAFSNRGYLLWLTFAMRWDDPVDDDYIARTRQAVAGLAPWTGRGVCVNMLNFDEQDSVVEALGGPEKYAGLARLKADRKS